MTHVVTRACIGCKDTSCALVCPVEAFHVGPTMLFINPEICIDCEQCVFECPVEAIHLDDDVPREFASDIELNKEMVERHPVFEL
ncbi:MAG: indolepyruvate ferredoxin oxidoreductase subunit alpha [Mariniblastus sp.]